MPERLRAMLKRRIAIFGVLHVDDDQAAIAYMREIGENEIPAFPHSRPGESQQRRIAAIKKEVLIQRPQKQTVRIEKVGSLHVLQIGEPSIPENAGGLRGCNFQPHPLSFAAGRGSVIRFDGALMQGHEALHPLHEVAAAHISATTTDRRWAPAAHPLAVAVEGAEARCW